MKRIVNLSRFNIVVEDPETRKEIKTFPVEKLENEQCRVIEVYDGDPVKIGEIDLRCVRMAVFGLPRRHLGVTYIVNPEVLQLIQRSDLIAPCTYYEYKIREDESTIHLCYFTKNLKGRRQESLY